jgi:hypothetical protein
MCQYFTIQDFFWWFLDIPKFSTKSFVQTSFFQTEKISFSKSLGDAGLIKDVAFNSNGKILACLYKNGTKISLFSHESQNLKPGESTQLEGNFFWKD